MFHIKPEKVKNGKTEKKKVDGYWASAKKEIFRYMHARYSRLYISIFQLYYLI